MSKHLHGMVSCGVLLALGVGAARGDEFIWKNGKWIVAPRPAAGTPAGELAIIRMHVDQRQRKAALAAAERFAARYPDDPLREEAMLLAGQAELDAGRYYQAYERFEKMLDEYPNGRFLERALTREMEVANAFLAGKKRIVGKVLRLPAKDEGLEILRRIVEHAPGATIAEKAMLRIGEYHFDAGEFAEASAAYDEYLQLFPKGLQAPKAMAQAARAMHLSFKGVPYDETPLVEAEHRYRMLMEQYPAAARKARAEQVLREIAEVRAQRAYKTARFYQRTRRPKAAKFYYRQVIEQYPSSAWAAAARAELGGEAPRRRPAPAPKPAPAVTPKPKPRPAPAPAPKPAPKPAPAVVKPKPAAKPTTAPGPIDLEKLADPNRKGGSK